MTDPTTYDIVFGFWDATFSAFNKYWYWVVMFGMVRIYEVRKEN